MPPVDSIAPGPDTLRILLTTDNHVGYLDSDPVRGDDSWITFDEITQLAKTHDVDMIVQGGDLFHVSRPSKKALFHVIKSLRQNCLGDRPCELELLSDPALALRNNDHVNYEDPNLNVAIPMFAISGNHDDATGEGLLSPLDVMAATGLMNYFGQVPAQEKLQVSPLIFQKGTTKFALYGINNVRDERLQRLMRSGSVTFQTPANSSEFFNLLCIHQNHHRRTLTSYVPEDFLPLFLDFVFWGHEHECIPFPQFNPTTGFDTLQAGSSVATSLSDGETAKKHVFILDIKGTDYALTPIPLKTVRPFVMEDVSLKEENFIEGPASKADIIEFLLEKVNGLLLEAVDLYKAAGGTNENVLPLVRLRVDQTGDYEVENARRFSNRFVGKIANVNDIIHYFSKKNQERDIVQARVPNNKVEAEITQKVSIQQLLKEHLGDSSLHLVPEDGIFDVTRKFIEQDDKQVFQDFVKMTLEKATSQLLNVDLNGDEILMGENDTVRKSYKELLTKLKYEEKKSAETDTPGPAYKISREKAMLELAQPVASQSRRVRKSAVKSQPTVESSDDEEGSEIVVSSETDDEIIDSGDGADSGDFSTAKAGRITSTRKEPVKKTTKKLTKKPTNRVTKASKKASPKKSKNEGSILMDDLLSLG